MSTLKPIKKEKVKIEKKIKEEKDIKLEATTSTKQPRALSAEISLTKRPNTLTRRRAKAMEELDDSFVG